MDLNAVAALIQERDELKGHALRLAEEVESAAQTNIALTGRLTVAETQREALQAERDELKGHLARLAAELAEAHAQILAGQPISLFVEPGHFYSPVVDPASPFVTKALAAAEAIGNSGTIPAVDVSDQRMLAEFAKLCRWYPEMPFTPEKSDGLRYYLTPPPHSAHKSQSVNALAYRTPAGPASPPAPSPSVARAQSLAAPVPTTPSTRDAPS